MSASSQKCSYCCKDFGCDNVFELKLCGHILHQNCMEECLKPTDKCPICKANINSANWYNFRNKNLIKSLNSYNEIVEEFIIVIHNKQFFKSWENIFQYLKESRPQLIGLKDILDYCLTGVMLTRDEKSHNLQKMMDIYKEEYNAKSKIEVLDRLDSENLKLLKLIESYNGRESQTIHEIRYSNECLHNVYKIVKDIETTILFAQKHPLTKHDWSIKNEEHDIDIIDFSRFHYIYENILQKYLHLFQYIFMLRNYKLCPISDMTCDMAIFEKEISMTFCRTRQDSVYLPCCRKYYLNVDLEFNSFMNVLKCFDCLAKDFEIQHSDDFDLDFNFRNYLSKLKDLKSFDKSQFGKFFIPAFLNSERSVLKVLENCARTDFRNSYKDLFGLKSAYVQLLIAQVSDDVAALQSGDFSRLNYLKYTNRQIAILDKFLMDVYLLLFCASDFPSVADFFKEVEHGLIRIKYNSARLLDSGYLTQRASIELEELISYFVDPLLRGTEVDQKYINEEYQF